MQGKTRKGIAPDEIGQLPNERRCKRCGQLLSVMEVKEGEAYWWCRTCQITYEPYKGVSPSDNS